MNYDVAADSIRERDWPFFVVETHGPRLLPRETFQLMLIAVVDGVCRRAAGVWRLWVFLGFCRSSSPLGATRNIELQFTLLVDVLTIETNKSSKRRPRPDDVFVELKSEILLSLTY